MKIAKIKMILFQLKFHFKILSWNYGFQNYYKTFSIFSSLVLIHVKLFPLEPLKQSYKSVIKSLAFLCLLLNESCGEKMGEFGPISS